MEERRTTRRTTRRLDDVGTPCVVMAQNGLYLRSAPSQSAPVVRVLQNGSPIIVEKTKGDWAKVQGGWVMTKFTSYR